jgi:hypothetical protein
MVRVVGIALVFLLSGCGRSALGGSAVASASTGPNRGSDASAADGWAWPAIDEGGGVRGGQAGDTATPFVARAVYVGNDSSFALLGDGRLASWGRNDSGQLGNGADGSFRVDELGFSVVALAADWHTCFLDAGGLIRCSGSNYYYQLGDGTSQNRLTPTLVSVISAPARLVAVGGRTCVHTTPPAIECWGASYSGPDLRTVSEGFEYIGLAVGGNFVCAAGVGGIISCWGSYGVWQGGVYWVGAQAGNPTDVPDAVEVVAGFDHGCARTTEGLVWCWGDHSGGQLGVTTPPAICTDVRCSPKPIIVELPAGVRASRIAARKRATLAVTTDGRVFGWGGLETDGTCDRHPVCSWLPRQLVGFDDVIDAALGGQHICLRRRDGSVWCWGSNLWKQVSGRETTFIEQPVRVIPP